ncbi:YrhB domain-containing protein [Thermocrispum agreste]|uniref:YrhB domain-containing protein n=1 Tax=Thermocrispum agreste TaxID=37925 RepID=A0A2W4JNL0_9PSEU|nr:YrhB domain-containing protein [Thermocrispum agreste]PZM99305.1 MAG: hypothetical protein DIU77_06135 [Thermocrispum agreste]
MADEPVKRAREWLDRTYGGLVVVSDQPSVESTWATYFSCAYADAKPDDKLLAVTLAVPKDGSEPFPLPNARPFGDIEDIDVVNWRWGLNARGSLVAAHAELSNRPASALGWRPEDEAPGWWQRLLDQHFPDAEVATCATWDEVRSAVLDGGPDTRGVVWLRRRFAGMDFTGHLLYACYDNGEAMLLDPQLGDIALVDDDVVDSLVLARFTGKEPLWAEPVMPTLVSAPDLESAVRKAESWLTVHYGDAMQLVDPHEDDEMERGWLFACATKRYLDSGDWRHQTLHAAVVVPKEPGEEPFGLPLDDPWGWVHAWDHGVENLREPPPPDPAELHWLEELAMDLDVPYEASTHHSWDDVLEEIAELPAGQRVVVWARRRDHRDRETVGNVFIGFVDEDGEALLLDAETGEPMNEPEPLAVHVIRFDLPAPTDENEQEDANEAGQDAENETDTAQDRTEGAPKVETAA